MAIQPDMLRNASEQARAEAKTPPAVKASDPALKPLSFQQQAFVFEYVIDFNGTRAAIAAKYSEKTAASQASRLLRNANIQAAIAALMAPKHEENESTRQYVRRKLIEEIETKEDSTASSRAQALSLYGKTDAVYTDKVLTDGKLNITIIDSYDDSKANPDGKAGDSND